MSLPVLILVPIHKSVSCGVDDELPAEYRVSFCPEHLASYGLCQENLVSEIIVRSRCFHLLSSVSAKKQFYFAEKIIFSSLVVFSAPFTFSSMSFLYFELAGAVKPFKIDHVYIELFCKKLVKNLIISKVNLIAVICFDAHRESIKLVTEKRCKTYIRRVINFTVPFIRNHR